MQTSTMHIDEVKQALCAIEGAEVPGENRDEGKLIVVLQESDSDRLFSRIESTKDIPNVLAVSLVYHQQDEQDEEIT